MGTAFDNSQRAFCESPAENIRLLAPAGSGKTLSLLERCRWLAEHKIGAEKPRFLVVTFTRAARDELWDRLNTDSRFLLTRSLIKIHTLNQWGYSYLKNNQSSLTIKKSESEKSWLITHDLRAIWIDYPLLAPILEKCKDKADVIDIMNDLKSCGFQHNLTLPTNFLAQVDWLNQNGLGRYFESAITEKLRKLDLLNGQGQTLFDQFEPFIKFWAQASEHLWKSAIISLEDQKYWALLLLQQRYKSSFFPEPNRYHHIMVDEFQDINPLDLRLIKQLADVNKSTLTIVGDDDQAIFEWRGSSPNFILNPNTHFGRTFSTYQLSKNYRSPQNIVSKSQNLISHNKNRENKVFPSCENQKDAEIILRTFNTHVDSLDLVIELAIKANQAGSPKQLAIVARKKSQNIPYYAKEDLNILLSGAFEDLKKILYITCEKALQRNSSDVVDDFIKCCNYVALYPLKKNDRDSVRQFLIEKQPRTFLQALDLFGQYRGKLFLQNSEYVNAIRNVTYSSTVSKAIEQIEQYFKGMQAHYGKSDDDIFYKDPPFFYLAEFAKKYKGDFASFITQIEKVIAINSNRYDEISDEIDADLRYPVHIMTAPRAKGKEFETVVLLDVNDDIWPNRLNTEESELEQERRIFYVAVTRARQKLVLLTVKSIAGKTFKPSPYIAEMDVFRKNQQTPVKGDNLPKLPSHAQSPTAAKELIPSIPKTKPLASSQAATLNFKVPTNVELLISDTSVVSKKLPEVIKRAFRKVFEINESFIGWVTLHEFRINLYKKYPDFDALVKIQAFDSLEHALKSDPNFIEISQDRKSIRLRRYR